MVLLAFDTAGPNCAVAVARNGSDRVAILSRMEERIGRGHAERLPGMVAEALADAGVAYADLERIAVTVGPGSFTGARVGVAFARGLGLALEVPVVGIGSLDALMRPLMRTHEGTAVAVLDAKRDEVFASVKDRAAGTVLVEPQAMSVDDLALRLADSRPPIVATGAGVARLAADLIDKLGIQVVGQSEAPDIADVADLAATAEAGAPPRPHYARAPDAKPQRGKAVERA